MIESKDQLGQVHTFLKSPQRVVSLVPSLTELLVDVLALSEEQKVIGCTKFCVHPAHLRETARVVGGTKNIGFDSIRALAPDLIVASKEENVQQQVEPLRKLAPVWVSDVTDLISAREAIIELSTLLGFQSRGLAILQANQLALKELKAKSSGGPALYLIWRKPYMAAGGDTYIHAMLEALGHENVLADAERYPTLLAEDVVRLAPSCIMLSSEPYPFRQKHLKEFQKLCPKAQISLVDGELYSWYGSRLGKLSEMKA